MRFFEEIETKKQKKRRAARGRRTGLLLPVLAPLLAVTLAACDISGLLDVDLPGDVTAESLSNPVLAESLVLSAQGDFECGLVDHIWYAGQWFEEFLNTGTGRPNALMGLRTSLVDVYADPCDSGTGPVWTVLQVPRQDARFAVETINGYPAGTIVPNKNFLIAKARLYEGYSTQLLAEQFCFITIDGGPRLTREQGYDLAIGHFTEAITLGSGVTGARAAEAAAVVAAAYIGRARAKLNKGTDMPGVIADASSAAIPVGFQYMALYDANPGRRRNRLFENINEGNGLMPHVSYDFLTVAADGTLTVANGTPDPRVVIDHPAGELDGRGVLQKRNQMKYPSRAADIPFSTWREAQLMIAEASQGQTAVNIINALRDTHPSIASLDFVSADPAEIEATLQEERRRELWMTGVQAGDKLRWGTPFLPQDEYGQNQNPGGCLAVPRLEVLSNTNY